MRAEEERVVARLSCVGGRGALGRMVGSFGVGDCSGRGGLFWALRECWEEVKTMSNRGLYA